MKNCILAYKYIYHFFNKITIITFIVEMNFLKKKANDKKVNYSQHFTLYFAKKHLLFNFIANLYKNSL